MSELIIILSRYLFVLYIVFFLWQGINYIAAERGLQNIDKGFAAAKQRVVIVFMHITAFLILSYIPGTFSFDPEILLIGGGCLVFFIAAHVAVERVYQGSCPLIWNGIFFLMDTGLITLTRLNVYLAQKQLIWFFVGFAAALLIPLGLKIIPKFEKLEPIYMIVGFGLLSATFLFGQEEFGATNWIMIGDMSFQPSEAVKFIFVIYLASAFRKKLTLRQMMIPAAVSAAYVLVLVVQRDLGGALIFFMTFMVMMYVATGSEILFFSGMGAFAAASVVAYHLFYHVQVRVAIWQNPWEDVYGTGNQIVQSLFAIGTWGLLGSGLTRGFARYVPVVTRDVIFAAVCEEMGSIFGMGIIGVYIMLFYRGAHIALRSRRRYYTLLAVGLTGMLAFQTFLIIGGTIKLIPLTGVTLPFISYGGSSVLVSTLMVGILQWIFMFYREDMS